MLIFSQRTMTTRDAHVRCFMIYRYDRRSSRTSTIPSSGQGFEGNNRSGDTVYTAEGYHRARTKFVDIASGFGEEESLLAPFCTNYRKLNAVTQFNAYLLPRRD